MFCDPRNHFKKFKEHLAKTGNSAMYPKTWKHFSIMKTTSKLSQSLCNKLDEFLHYCINMDYKLSKCPCKNFKNRKRF